jgi:hypothetical protein
MGAKGGSEVTKEQREQAVERLADTLEDLLGNADTFEDRDAARKLTQDALDAWMRRAERR